LNSRLTEDFLACFAVLPDPVKVQARKAYRLWRQNAAHPSVQFKRVHAREPIYSARISLGWRALGLWEGDTIYWFWVGSHAEYDQLLEHL
jgi:hypothetical protein